VGNHEWGCRKDLGLLAGEEVERSGPQAGWAGQMQKQVGGEAVLAEGLALAKAGGRNVLAGLEEVVLLCMCMLCVYGRVGGVCGTERLRKGLKSPSDLVTQGSLEPGWGGQMGKRVVLLGKSELLVVPGV
jgi:hypothetical protein